MALTTDSTRNTGTLADLRGQALDQLHDRRLSADPVTELRFLEQSGTEPWSEKPRPLPEVIWAD